MYTATTKGLKVTVTPEFLEEHSLPDEDHFVWAYHIHIENQSPVIVQLMNRYWRITDAFGRTHEVRGPGVVGKQPVLEPGGSHEYSSGTSLKTPSGIMHGSYEMLNLADGNHFDIEVPAFSLDCPYTVVVKN